MTQGKILIIDDDADLQEVVKIYLETDFFEVVQVFNTNEALQKAKVSIPDVILLDLSFPDGSGLPLISDLKKISPHVAIIVVSGKTDTTEKIVCLEMGADDYITKPFEMRELSARIKAVMRRIEPVKADEENNSTLDDFNNIYFEGGWCLNKEQYQLFSPNNESADLTTGEFKLLEILVTSANRALTRNYLFDLTREDNYDVYDRAIDIQIARLRKKIKIDKEDLIKTVRGVGYMFTGKIDEVKDV